MIKINQQVKILGTVFVAIAVLSGLVSGATFPSALATIEDTLLWSIELFR